MLGNGLRKELSRQLATLNEPGVAPLQWARMSNLVVYCDSAELGERISRDIPEVVEAHHVTGDDCFTCKVYVGSVAELERVIGELAIHGSTTTSILLSSPVARRAFAPRAG